MPDDLRYTREVKVVDPTAIDDTLVLLEDERIAMLIRQFSRSLYEHLLAVGIIQLRKNYRWFVKKIKFNDQVLIQSY